MRFRFCSGLVSIPPNISLRVPLDGVIGLGQAVHLKIPFADISEVSHIYDSGNGNTDATNPVITVVSSGNRLTVEGCDKTPMIEIYDLSGHLIHHERTDSAELPSGIYIVIVDKINIFKTKI